MNPAPSQLDSPRRLSELLQGQHEWSAKEALLLVRNLAAQVRALHQQGQTHRAIDAESVSVDERLQPQLADPPATRRFGAECSDPEFCPPELAEADRLELPEKIEEAAETLRSGGHQFDPRRVDLYQLGTLLCRLLTGESIRSYMYSPTTKANVPAVARSVLERMLGYDGDSRLEDCDRLIEALEEAIERAAAASGPSSVYETPARGSQVVGREGETPARGQPPASGVKPGPEAADYDPKTSLCFCTFRPETPGPCTVWVDDAEFVIETMEQ